MARTRANWKELPGPDFIKKEMAKNPTANVGILTGLSRLTVVDIDEPYLLDEMLERFEDTPLIIETPRGGFHLYYRSTGERNRQRLDGLKVDIRGIGGMVVVPYGNRASYRARVRAMPASRERLRSARAIARTRAANLNGWRRCRR